MPTIRLSPDDFSVCLHLAQERAIESLRNDRKDALFEKDWVEAHRIHVIGAVGEVAFAKWLGVYPSFGVRQFSGMMADIEAGCKYEVRHRLKTNHDLIIRDNDPADRVYILTRGCPPEVEVAGWCWGGEFKGREDFTANWGSHGECLFVPAQELHDMTALPRG